MGDQRAPPGQRPAGRAALLPSRLRGGRHLPPRGSDLLPAHRRNVLPVHGLARLPPLARDAAAQGALLRLVPPLSVVLSRDLRRAPARPRLDPDRGEP